ncbi:MAG: transposase [Proteobacteria bacterium]|nr:transposase [Pseudomonadota bacterium]MBU4298138.1 transposase [Pseudomonadota bacterium]
MLKKEGRIDDTFIQNIMKWRHTSGFSVHNGMRISRDDKDGQEALAQYIIRSPFSLEKITYKAETGMVIYKSKMTHGKNKSNFRIFNAGEFIAAICQHIPDKSFQLSRYFGWYSNRSRGERRKEAGQQADTQDSTPVPEEIEVLDVSTYKPRGIPAKSWRECIKKVWEVDPLECSKCHAEMKIISFITEQEVIRRILEHLNLWLKKPANSNRDPPELKPDQVVRETVYGEPFDDGWPGADDDLLLDEVYPD